MISSAWTWATNTKNIRRNSIHGEEEANLILDEAFEANDQTTNETTMQGGTDVQEDSGFLLEGDVPDIESNAAAIASGQANGAAAASSAQDKLKKIGGTRAQTLRDQLETILSSMRELFNKLTVKQPFSDSLLRLFAETTKQDLIMNNYVVRARSVKGGAGSSTDKPAKKEKSKPKNSGKAKKDKKDKKSKSAKEKKDKKDGKGSPKPKSKRD
ncbi:unnamed protein product [Symbiodinium sp. CCMP2592]|nr:unnamed protein product [Symbiodinium sp. CCMP2592]CAE7809527.1 unnamed protein product [Symbiodinium sp. CCMP2592]